MNRLYTSQDNGTMENRIGTIRPFFPKCKDLRHVTEKSIKSVELYVSNGLIRKFDALSTIQQSLKLRVITLVTWSHPFLTLYTI